MAALSLRLECSLIFYSALNLHQGCCEAEEVDLYTVILQHLTSLHFYYTVSSIAKAIATEW